MIRIVLRLGLACGLVAGLSGGVAAQALTGEQAALLLYPPTGAEVELLKETGRLLFMRGIVMQGESRVAAFSGTIRKPTKK